MVRTRSDRSTISEEGNEEKLVVVEDDHEPSKKDNDEPNNAANAIQTNERLPINAGDDEDNNMVFLDQDVIELQMNDDDNATTKKKITGQPKGRNALTKLIPGYTAPLSLDSGLSTTATGNESAAAVAAASASASIDRGSHGALRSTLAQLRQKAQSEDVSTRDFVAPTVAGTLLQRSAGNSSVTSSKDPAKAMQRTSNGFMPSTYVQYYSNFSKGRTKQADSTAGAGWFHFQPTKMTDELKADVHLIRNRNYLDPKRFYKSSDWGMKKKGATEMMVQMGTVIEGTGEYFSSRLSKRNRRSTFADEIMTGGEDGGEATSHYIKSRYTKMTQAKQAMSAKRKRFQQRAQNRNAKRTRKGR